MDVRDFEVFLAVAKHLHFSHAGDEVHLSQPSVSVRIRRLEEELQTKLFEQIGRKVKLTEAGRILEPYARRVVTSMEDSRNAVEEYRGLAKGSLRIGASTTPGMYIVPRLIARFKNMFPKIAVSLNIKNTRQVEEDIIKDVFDLGFVGGHLISNEIETYSWLTDELVLIAPPNHPLSGRKKIKLNDLTKETLIIRETGSATRAEVEKHLPLLNFPMEAILELGNPEAVKQVVREGLGIAFLSRFAIEMELKAKSLAVLNVEGLSIHRELKIIYRKGKHLSAATGALIQTARQL
jgi:DNA-binding transcriptional LysR family regulator